MRRLTAIIFSIAATIMVTQAGQADHSGIPTNPPRIAIPAPAIEAAGAWLALVDDGDASQSWNQADPYFQSQASLDQWTDTVKHIRRTFGQVTARSFMYGQVLEQLPNAPAGQYVVLRFSLACRRWARETVTVKQEGSAWKVSGYYVGEFSGPLYVPGVGALPMH